ncbi:N-6 DNA methylase [Flavobacterium sp.]|uniref:N-6 DNA methylase n=1 Tax=Flavobacterium sp. TaxID=239 RepID=UPI0031D8E139
MLDNITKRRIDDCRDILVGKLPDPKSQIEQITIALIYKFMDDMDKEAIELGGKAKFFSDYKIPDPNDSKKEIIVSFEKYSWDNLFDTKVSATEMLKLYSEAIEGMVKNPNIPDLFANIFKNAYLPYRDPETLKMFLKTISEFEYTHSEKLGDAFEYLLSVMGSQGDAGQFRTPRHIIDFLVEIVDPKKDETILDPACGTAGFLISAFKHIKENNNNLTPDERKKLIKNFIGYDISPDMVRLSLVNLYLHGFSDPHVFEYDTLSSEDRWDETFDVVLANPPFMSPKGGIRPHKKFTINSNRSEVLFVDYIAEHLNPKGRAGIIVPEGIIFQSGTAYKALRKMLVDKYLYAVVSLPAGVFNPYSGVKTSILLMDANLSKKTKDILFIKIDNDGYSLGAQRNPVKGGQLQEAVSTLKTFRQNCIDGKEFDNTTLAQRVTKTEIGKSGDYNLSGERYKNTVQRSSSFQLHEIGSVCNLVNGTSFKPSDWETKDNGGLPIIRIQNLNNKHADFNYYSGKIADKFIVEPEDLLFSWSGSRGTSFGAHIWYGRKAILNQHIFNVHFDKEKAIKKYLYLILNQVVEEVEQNLHGGVGLVHITKGNLEKIKIPLPSLSVQKEIVAEIEGYQKIIDGAKMVVDNYKPRIEIDKEWEILEFGGAPFEIIDGDRGTNYPNGDDFQSEGYCLFLNTKNVRDNGFRFNERMFITKEKDEKLRKGKLQREDIILTTRGTIGNTAYYNKSVAFENVRINSGMVIFRPNNNKILSEYLYYFIQSENCQIQFNNIVSGAAQPQLPIRDLKFAKIPLPTIKTQQKIVSQIEKEQALVNANKELITIYVQKIKDRIAKVWGEKEQKIVSKKLSNDLYLAMILKQMEKKIQLNYGEVATQKTVFHLNTFTNQKLDYPFMNSNYGTYSYQLKDDLLNNPYLTKTKKGNGEVFVVTSSKENEILEALSNPDNKDFVDAINEILNIYQAPLINKETENIELLNTVSKVILDQQTTDLEIVYKEMENWEINQNGFKTKADKFTKAKTKKMIGLIEKLGLVSKLLTK